MARHGSNSSDSWCCVRPAQPTAGRLPRTARLKRRYPRVHGKLEPPPGVWNNSATYWALSKASLKRTHAQLWLEDTASALWVQVQLSRSHRLHHAETTWNVDRPGACGNRELAIGRKLSCALGQTTSDGSVLSLVPAGGAARHSAQLIGATWKALVDSWLTWFLRVRDRLTSLLDEKKGDTTPCSRRPGAQQLVVTGARVARRPRAERGIVRRIGRTRGTTWNSAATLAVLA